MLDTFAQKDPLVINILIVLLVAIVPQAQPLGFYVPQAPIQIKQGRMS